MMKAAYRITVSSWSVNSADDARTEFVELETKASLDSPDDLCRISVYAPAGPQPGLLEGAVTAAAGALGLGGEEEGAFSVQLRGKKVKPGDGITIALTAGDLSEKVMTAEVQTIESSLGQTKIMGRSGMQKLADTRINQVYENQNFGQIVNDLAGQAGIDTGHIETGSTYSYLVVHESRNLLRNLRQLAMREGMEMYFDPDNKLTMKKFTKTSADHTFRYGIDILDLKTFNQQTPSGHILVYGESPASNQGADTWHWMAKDLSPFRSEVGEGARTLALQDGAVRTKDAADLLATSKFGAVKDGSTWGRLKILGNPRVKLADALEIKNVPKAELNGLFKVTSVGHIFNKREGFLTLVGFTGQGGAKKASGLLGEVGGRLAGALGL